jgi:hypothetical protein
MAHYPRKWFVGLDMYNQLAPFFGHEPIPPTPIFPTTDQFLTDYRQTNSNNMTEQGLIEYAKIGSQSAIAHLASAGFEGIDWTYAITHVNGGWLPSEDIKRVWGEMIKINQETGMEMPTIQSQLQAALDTHHKTTRKVDPVLAMSPAGRPWDFNFKHKVKFGKGSNRMPPKKKRK